MHNRRTIEKVRWIAVRHAKSKGWQELKWAIEEEMKDRGLEWDETVIKDAITSGTAKPNDRAINPHLYRRPISDKLRKAQSCQEEKEKMSNCY
ncbi:MAG: hypothetical protein LH613_14520 [Chamaesiphon sp.]|nr:hypothetical protein [Chamaesiphon sp.]